MKLASLAPVLVGCVVGCVDATPPELMSITPADRADLRGVGTLTIKLEVREDGDGVAELGLAGAEVPPRPFSGCADGCTVTWDRVDVSHVPAGAQELQLRLRDASGNTSDTSHELDFADVITVNQLAVTNTIDDAGTLEMEVYVRSAAGDQLGCAGTEQGLGSVDASDVRYAVAATLIDETRQPLSLAELGSTPFHFEAWEDDDDPVCPSLLDPAGNDLVGASYDLTAEQWRSVTGPLRFGDVTALAISVGRPLTLE